MQRGGEKLLHNYCATTDRRKVQQVELECSQIMSEEMRRSNLIVRAMPSSRHTSIATILMVLQFN